MAKPVISARDIEQLLARGGDIGSLPADAIITPAARDLMRGREVLSKIVSRSGIPGNPPDLEEYKRQICDIGRRLWERAYVDGNGGNLCIRLGENLVLCTPTQISKGFMKPEDLCLVDMEGRHVGGTRKPTSEILTHLAILKVQPKARATVHCHPPYGTAFAVAGVKPPTCMVSEIEISIGEVPIVEYSTPGTPPLGEAIARLAGDHNTLLMANHGAISWADTLENAYMKMEVLEAYCRTMVVGTHLGVELKTFSPKHLQDLMSIKQKLGVPDRRIGLKECELCDNDEWRPGVTCTASPSDAADAGADPVAERLVREITDQIFEQARKQG